PDLPLRSPTRPAVLQMAFAQCRVMRPANLGDADLPWLSGPLVDPQVLERSLESARRWVHWSLPSLPRLHFLLEDSLGFFQRVLPCGRQVLAGAIDEVRDHATPRADALGTDLLRGHDPRDGLGVLRVQPGRRERGDGLYVLDPTLFGGHDSLVSECCVL